MERFVLRSYDLRGVISILQRRWTKPLVSTDGHRESKRGDVVGH